MQILEGHTSPVYALAFSPDAYWLASGSKDGVVLFWEAGGNSPRHLLPCDDVPGILNAISFSPSGNTVVAAVTTGWYGRHNFTQDDFQDFAATGELESVSAMSYVGPELLVLGYGKRGISHPGQIELWDMATDRRREPRFQEPFGVRSLATDLASKSVAWTNGSRRATVWDIVKPQPVHFNLKHNSPSVAFHPDGHEIAVAQEWGFCVLDLTRRQERLAVRGHKGQVSSVAYSPDGRTLATGSWDGTVRLWDAASGSERHAFRWPTGRVYALAASPDGTRMAAAGETGQIVVWDAE